MTIMMHILCTICTDLVNPTENLHATHCGHLFHHHCLTEWIERSNTCPQCRRLVTGSRTFRVYPTISDETPPEVATLQIKLDEASRNLKVLKDNEELLKVYTQELDDRNHKLECMNYKVENYKATIERCTSLNDDFKRDIERHTSLNDALRENVACTARALKMQCEETERWIGINSDLKKNIQILKKTLLKSEFEKNELRKKLCSEELACITDKLTALSQRLKLRQLTQKNLVRTLARVHTVLLASQQTDNNAHKNDIVEKLSGMLAQGVVLEPKLSKNINNTCDEVKTGTEIDSLASKSQFSQNPNSSVELIKVESSKMAPNGTVLKELIIASEPLPPEGSSKGYFEPCSVTKQPFFVPKSQSKDFTENRIASEEQSTILPKEKGSMFEAIPKFDTSRDEKIMFPAKASFGFKPLSENTGTMSINELVNKPALAIVPTGVKLKVETPIFDFSNILLGCSKQPTKEIPMESSSFVFAATSEQSTNIPKFYTSAEELTVPTVISSRSKPESEHTKTKIAIHNLNQPKTTSANLSISHNLHIAQPAFELPDRFLLCKQPTKEIPTNAASASQFSQNPSSSSSDDLVKEQTSKIAPDRRFELQCENASNVFPLENDKSLSKLFAKGLIMGSEPLPYEESNKGSDLNSVTKQPDNFTEERSACEEQSTILPKEKGSFGAIPKFDTSRDEKIMFPAKASFGLKPLSENTGTMSINELVNKPALAIVPTGVKLKVETPIFDFSNRLLGCSKQPTKEIPMESFSFVFASSSKQSTNTPKFDTSAEELTVPTVNSFRSKPPDNFTEKRSVCEEQSTILPKEKGSFGAIPKSIFRDDIGRRDKLRSIAMPSDSSICTPKFMSPLGTDSSKDEVPPRRLTAQSLKSDIIKDKHIDKSMPDKTMGCNFQSNTENVVKSSSSSFFNDSSGFGSKLVHSKDLYNIPVNFDVEPTTVLPESSSEQLQAPDRNWQETATEELCKLFTTNLSENDCEYHYKKLATSLKKIDWPKTFKSGMQSSQNPTFEATDEPVFEMLLKTFLRSKPQLAIKNNTRSLCEISREELPEKLNKFFESKSKIKMF